MFLFKGPGLAQPSDGGAGPDLAALLQRSQLALFGSLVLLTIGAWGLTIMQAQSMPEMGGVVAPVTSDGQMAAGDDMDSMGDMDAMGEMEVMPPDTIRYGRHGRDGVVARRTRGLRCGLGRHDGRDDVAGRGADAPALPDDRRQIDG